MAISCMSTQLRVPVVSQARASASRQPAQLRIAPFTAAPLRLRNRLQGRTVEVRAKEFDFDQLLSDTQDKFEASDNKPAVIGYSVAAVFAFFFAEWFIHLPLFNFLLGFPLQLLGLLIAPYLAVRYLADGEDWYADASDAADKVIAQLPGLNKKRI
jgi:hypothetical protein